MCNSIECTHIVIYDDTAAIYPSTYTVEEHQWHTTIYKPLEMVITSGVLCLRHDYPTNLVLKERLAYFHLTVILFITLRHHDKIPS